MFSSPVAAQLLKESDGVLRGKGALREYWTQGLALIPDLRFEVVGVYTGTSAIVINYRNQKGGLVCEVLILRDGWWSRGTGRIGTRGPTTIWPGRWRRPDRGRGTGQAEVPDVTRPL